MQTVETLQEDKLFFINCAGGTGKSFVWNTIASACHLKGYIVLCVAS
jgi:phage/plasmid-associated DNA primase